MTSRRSLLLIALCAAGCQHAAPTPTSTPDELHQQLAGADIDWDSPRLQTAIDALQRSNRSLIELQALAPQQLALAGEPSSQLVLGRADDPQLAAEIGLLAPARCAAAGPAPALVLCSRTLLEFERAPVALAPGELLLVSGRALRKVLLSEAWLLECNGRLSTLSLEQRGREFTVSSQAPLKGHNIVELMVETERGREVAALWEVAVSGYEKSDCPATQPATAGDTAKIHGDDPADPTATARAFYAGLGADRAAANLQPVAWSDRLAAFAQARAQLVAGMGQLVHTPADQLALLRDDRGLALSWFGENVARGLGADDVRAAILRSPSHRRNHLAPDARSVGIGAAWRCHDGRCTLFLVELLARAYADTDASGLTSALLGRINQLRQAQGVPGLDLDVGLAATARQLAQRMADQNQLLTDAPDEPALTQQLMAARSDLLAAGAAVFRADSADGVALRPLLLLSSYNVVGIGVARRDPGSPWYVAVIVAENGDPGEPAP